MSSIVRIDEKISRQLYHVNTNCQGGTNGSGQNGRPTLYFGSHDLTTFSSHFTITSFLFPTHLSRHGSDRIGSCSFLFNIYVPLLLLLSHQIFPAKTLVAYPSYLWRFCLSSVGDGIRRGVASEGRRGEAFIGR